VTDTDLSVIYLAAGVTLTLLMFPLMWRIMRGPTVLDRIVAANVIGAKTTILVVIIGALFQHVDMFVDIALTYALLNFIVSIAAARFFRRKGLVPGQSMIGMPVSEKRRKS
jgi:multicomponent Na+:H+ antiporter subunit F